MGHAMNRNALPFERKLTRALRQRPEWRVLPAAFLATLLALPVNAAVTIPSDPLASGVRVAPNILFILDDSGSMAWENINNSEVTSLTGTNFSDNAGKNGIGDGYEDDLTDETNNNRVYEQTYTTNTLYYNPFVDYQPWMNANGNRLTGGTDYNDAYSSNNYVDYSGVESNSSSGQINLSNNTRTFHAPKDPSQSGSTYLSNIANYYRYQIIAGGADVVRSEWGQVTDSGWIALSVSPGSGNVSSSNVNVHTLAAVPAGARLYLQMQSTNSRHARYDLRNPSGGVVCTLQFGDSETRYCDLPSTLAGAYTLEVRDGNPDSNAAYYQLSAWYRTTNRCGNGSGSYDWIDCTSNRPDIPNASGTGTTQRSVADEKTNFATWYSYYRSRTKSAKGGAAEAFNTLGNRVRVGYRTIHNRSNFNIPVQDGNDGRFVNNDGTNGNPATTSRSVWFNRLFNANANDGTPLQRALDDAGQYFSGNAASGPYGPEATANQLSCRQNFSILTTDGYWNTSTINTDNDSHGDGYNGSVITNGPAAADGGVAVTDSKYKTYQYKKPAPYKDSNSNTLADVAMRYWKRDLRTDLANNVPSDYSKVAGYNDQVGRDPAFWQHMVTFAISIGLKAKSGLSSVEEVTAATTWEAPGYDDSDNVDDLLHAAVNGRGTFVSASSPQAFADGLAAALSKIEERTAAFSNVGASDTTQLNNGTLIFTASYVSARWTGLLRAENAVTGVEVWKTTDAGKFAAHGSRKVITRGGSLTGGVGGTGVGGGAAFPTSAQETALARTGGPANFAVTGANNASYIKGSTALAGSSPGQLRVRSTVMGDVVNSSPAYVADSHTVFVGANDGMLHAFDAATGIERFAYIPGIINFGHLADISRGDYEHRWFVDGPIAISPKTMSPDGAKNILVGALGRGGRGLYALDVTSPSTFAASNVKWERRSTNATAASDNMGMVLGMPILAKVRGSVSSAVVAGNGVNSGSDKAVLLVLNMDNGDVIREIATDNTTGNGLFAPTGIYAADGKTLVYAYAGDLQGNVWKFDMTSSTPSAWTAKKIFHAEKTTGTPQPITGGIASAVDPRTNKRWIFFGTGSYLTAADGNDTGTNKQSMYGVIDDITAGSAYTRSDLTSRSVTADSSGNERYFQDLASNTTKGWYVDLPGRGERIVQNAQIDGSYLVTASMMPSGDSCADAAGAGFINAITPFPDMAAGNKSYFDLDGDGNTDDAGTSGKPTGSVKTEGMPTLPLLMPGTLRYQTSAAGGGSLPKGIPQWNRVSWRELRND